MQGLCYRSAVHNKTTCRFARAAEALQHVAAKYLFVQAAEEHRVHAAQCRQGGRHTRVPKRVQLPVLAHHIPKRLGQPPAHPNTRCTSRPDIAPKHLGLNTPLGAALFAQGRMHPVLAWMLTA